MRSSLILCLALSLTAAFAVAGCTVESSGTCGNLILEPGEECDSINLGGETCQSLGFAGGTLGCSLSCGFDTSQCVNSVCGDGVAEETEECDGADLGLATCAGEGFDGGTLTCNNDCTLNTNDCSVCGDGNAERGEECDGNDFALAECSSFNTPGGAPFESGFLACTNGCTIDTSNCGVCGDNIAQAGEVCDGNDFNASCRTAGFAGGTLSACLPDCSASSAGCSRSDLGLCGSAGPRTGATAGTIPCSDYAAGWLWDVYTVTVDASDCVDVAVDNAGTGAADLLAAVYDQDASGMYGMVDDYSQLDDEAACTVEPWFAGAGCPAASVTARTAGTFTIIVGQWGGGCNAGMSDYQLSVAVNGTEVTPTQTGDDVIP